MNESMPEHKSQADSTRRQFLKKIGAGAVAGTKGPEPAEHDEAEIGEGEKELSRSPREGGEP